LAALAFVFGVVILQDFQPFLLFFLSEEEVFLSRVYYIYNVYVAKVYVFLKKVRESFASFGKRRTFAPANEG
jgi:hypothetical protein